MLPDLDRLAANQDGLLSRAQLTASGMSGATIDAMIRRGRWRCVLRGVYLVNAHENAEPTPTRVLARAAMLRWGPTAVISHSSAADLLGFPLLSTPPAWVRTLGLPPDPPSPRLTVTLEPARRAAAPGIEFRRARLASTDFLPVERIRVTTPTRTVSDMVRTAPLLAAVGVADAGSHRNPDLLGMVAMDLAQAPRGRGVAHGRRVLGLVSPKTESPLETMLRLLLHLCGLPAPVCQYEVQPLNGKIIGRVDLAFPDRGLLLEADGRTHHEAWSDGVRDRRRQNLLVTAGFRILRFTWDDVWSRPMDVVEAVRSALTP